MKKKSNKPYFSNKTCQLCKKPAKMYRSTSEKNYYLCSDKACDLRSRIEAGFFNKPDESI